MKKHTAPIIAKPRCTLPPNKVETPKSVYKRREKHPKKLG